MRQRAAGGQTPPGGVAVREHQGAQLGDLISRMETEFARALPSGDARQLVRDALTCQRTIKNLDKAEPKSVLGALMTCAQLGLRPGVLGHAWPLPFYDTKDRCYKAQLVIGYQGYIHLGYESDRVSSIRASVIREEDYWDWDEGSDQAPVHKRPKLGTDRGPVVGYYSRVVTTTGGLLVFLMDAPEMIQWRDRHAPRGKPPTGSSEGRIVGPWSGAPESEEYLGMALKTCIRRVAKHMPKSAQFARAEAVDGSVRVDVSAMAEPAVVSVVQGEVEAGPVELGNAPEVDPAAEVDPTMHPDWGKS